MKYDEYCLHSPSSRFGLLGLTCLEVTGDTDSEGRELDGADIIFATPEKFGEYT